MRFTLSDGDGNGDCDGGDITGVARGYTGVDEGGGEYAGGEYAGGT